MYCTNCGKKTKDGVKFCPHCGVSLDAIEPPKFGQELADDNETKENNKLKSKKKSNTCCAVLGAFFVVFLVLPFITISDKSGQLANIVGIVLIVAVIAVIVWLIVSLILKIKKQGIKKSLPFLIMIVLIILAFIASIFIYRANKYNEIFAKASFMQDKVTEIAAAKFLRDTLARDNAIRVGGFNLQDINNAVQAEKERLDSVSYPADLQGYKKVIDDWADKLINTKDYATWNTLSDGPENFEILIPDSWVKGIFEKAVYDIAAVRDAGDYAIKKQDRNSMRFVAARLIALDHLLASMETYQEIAQGKVIAPVYADYVSRGNVVMRTRNVCFINGKATICLPQAREGTRAAKGASKYLYEFVSPERYAQPDTPESQTDWSKSFTNIDEALDAANAQYLGGAGITQGEPDVAPQLSVREQAFRNQCRAKGGNPDPTSITKTRLPTTENGYNCQIGGCWEFMTANSGRTYRGGSPGCPEEGLVPEKSPWEKLADSINKSIEDSNKNNNNDNTPKPVSYDGVYNITYSFGNCGTNMPGVNLGSIGAFSDQITVKNNIVSFSGYTAKIDSNGRAQWSTNLSGMGNLQQIFNFNQSGVSGTFSFNVSTQGAAIGCNGSFTGSK